MIQEPDRIREDYDESDFRACSSIKAWQELDFAQIMNTIGQGVLITGEGWLFEYVNPAFARIVGQPLGDLTSKTMDDFIIPEDLPLLNHHRSKRLAGETTSYDFRLRRSDGNIIYVHATGVPRRLGDTIIGSISIIADITERKWTEEALRNSEERYRAFFRTSRDCVFITSVDGRWVDFNDATVQFFGYDSREELMDTSISDRYEDPDDRILHLQFVNKSEYLEEYPVALRKKDGTIIDTLITTVPIKDSTGTINGYQGTIRDITERKRANEALTSEKERLEIVTQNIGAGLAVVSRDYRTLWSNRVLSDLFGEGIGEVCYKHYNQRDEICPGCGVRKIFDYGAEKAVHEQIGKDSNGNTVWSEIIATPLRDKEGKITTALELVVPITERKLAEEALQIAHNKLEQRVKDRTKELARKNVEMERFIYTVSHDLRSPLISMSGFLSFIEQDAQKGDLDRLKSDLQIISDSVARMDGLLRSTLELSRIGRVVGPPEDVPFREIIEDALSQTISKIESRRVKVSVSPDMPIIYGDKMRIVEVLVNLIENSVKYMGSQEKPEIEFGQRIKGEERIFFVRDNGIGIDPSQHEKVFELFYKVDKNSEGAGAGMAIVKRIIEVHGGRIWIESELGKGCTVCFTLPLADGG